MSGHWVALTLALVCSLGVAGLWGANIAALYPVIETTLHGKSLQAWNAERLQAANRQMAELERQLAECEERIANGDESARAAARTERESLHYQWQAARGAVYAARTLQPWLDNWLPRDPFQTVVAILGVILAATCVKILLQLSGAMLVNRVSQGIARSIRLRIFDKALSLDRATFNQHGTSGFAAHLTQTTDLLASGLTSMYNGVVSEPLRILACLAGAWIISWRLTLVSLVLAPIGAGLILLVNRRLRGLSRRIFDRSIGFHHVLLEVFRALTTVQAYTMEDYERERFSRSTQAMRRSALQIHFLNALAGPITELFGIAMLCTGLTASAYLVIHQETAILGIQMTDRPLSVATAMIFFGMLLGAADPIRKLSGVITGINTGMVAANWLYPLMDLESKIVAPLANSTTPSSPASIELSSVTFGYDQHANVLTDVNLTIQPGERLAIIGPNGGGKSTLVNLLCRFYDPQAGTILLGGVPLRDLSLSSLRSRISLVTQETELFHESILHNIRYGRWDATQEEIEAAAKLARAHDFIQGLPHGYHTQVGPNGQRLSGGQRQRIALARALLRNADILILDEATSQIDVESERLIHEALAALPASRTIIMITHRQSTLALATRIVHVEKGRLTPYQAPARQAA